MSRSRTATSRPLCRSGTHSRRPLPGPRRRSAQPRDKLPLVAQASHPELISRRWYEARFGVYVEALTGVIGHADGATPLRDYCTGLLMPAERKSVEPMAAITAPARVAAQHQSLLHFVGQAPWSDAAVLTKVRDLVLPAIERAGPIEAWIIDDTGFPKKGRHSVGVARQYCGQLG